VKIVFMVGNGLDLHLDLKTRYSDFYSWHGIKSILLMFITRYLKQSIKTKLIGLIMNLGGVSTVVKLL
jgi:hypothetical protein